MAAHATLSHSPKTTQLDCRIPNLIFPPVIQFLSLRSLNSSWVGTFKLSPIRIPLPELSAVSATALSSLPTAKPERVFSSTEEVPKWSLKAIKSFALAELEARKLNSEGFGTEALLLGILLEGTNLAANFLWANGITLFKVREEAVKLHGAEQKKKLIKLYDDRDIVIDLEPPPLTESAQRALDWAFDKKLKSGESGEITPAHLLLGVWSEKESDGYKILAILGFDDEKAKQLETLISKPGICND